MLRVVAWVLGRQPLGLSSIQEVIVGRDEGEWGELVVYQSAVET